MKRLAIRVKWNKAVGLWKEPARVVVYRKNGSVQLEWTYGRDTRKRTG